MSENSMLLKDLESLSNSCYFKTSVVQLLLTSIYTVKRTILTRFNDDVFKTIIVYTNYPKYSKKSRDVQKGIFKRKVNSTTYQYILIDLMHIDYVISLENCKLLPICHQNNTFEVFFHGTSYDNGEKIVSNGIDFRKCGERCDFSKDDSKTFYVTDSLEYAKNYCKNISSRRYAIIVFKIPKAIFESYRNDALDLTYKIKDWHEVIKYFKENKKSNPEKPTEFEKRLRLLSAPYIKGPVNARDKGNHNIPDVDIQFGIKSTELANIFSRAEYMSLLLVDVKKK